MAYAKTTYNTGDVITAAKLNNEENATDSLRTFPTAAGTGTAITVTAYHFDLVAGFNLTFIAANANAAAATTLAVNGGAAKSIYKPGGTDAPNIIAGKAYTVWYDTASGGRFFVKASAEGDAVVGDVLAGKKFSNDSDTGLIGTRPGSNIKSIQSGVATCANAAAYVDVTITSVDVTKTITMVTFGTGTSTPVNSAFNIQLTSATVIRISRVGTTTAVDIQWTVIEFNNVKTLQRGLVQYTTAGTKAITITAVDLSKSLVFCYYTNGVGSPAIINCQYSLSSTTNIEFIAAFNAQIDLAWQVIEFN